MKLSERQKKILRFLGTRLASFFINVLLNSVRIKIQNREAVEKLISEKKNFVVAFWHGSMMLGWYLHRDMNCAALVSMSKDGDVLAHILSGWKFKVVRGSSHIGGKEALFSMMNLIKQNFSLTITPDGPTGPIHKMKAGAVITTKKTGVPLFLVGIGIKNKFVLKSWDKFEVPKPFAKISIIYSNPILIGQELSYDDTSKIIEQCETELNKLQTEALKLC
jgi:lysophospholipid acyltransferase (LPLAT)-like uncharacterized protein